MTRSRDQTIGQVGWRELVSSKFKDGLFSLLPRLKKAAVSNNVWHPQKNPDLLNWQRLIWLESKSLLIKQVNSPSFLVRYLFFGHCLRNENLLIQTKQELQPLREFEKKRHEPYLFSDDCIRWWNYCLCWALLLCTPFLFLFIRQCFPLRPPFKHTLSDSIYLLCKTTWRMPQSEERDWLSRFPEDPNAQEGTPPRRRQWAGAPALIHSSSQFPDRRIEIRSKNTFFFLRAQGRWGRKIRRIAIFHIQAQAARASRLDFLAWINPGLLINPRTIGFNISEMTDASPLDLE